ncbi:MAG TPA: winged helix DNA-binding domain-containing protein [Patescibacteria group bacterium]|nr:winged helix DNA-binding domain-containing protein [Patescibacteria group bacterium]
MTSDDIAQLRLYNQKIVGTTFNTPEEVVSYMGGMQAQDYLGSLWAIALRTKNCTEKDVEDAISERKIVRTWPMRRTLHFVPAADVHWMMKLTSERIIKTYGAHMPQLGLNEEILAHARNVVTKALTGGKIVTRPALTEALEKAGIDTKEGRGLHLIWRLGQESLICFGPREGKQQTFVLLDEWLPKKKNLSREEAVGELTLRYFTSHGPATIHDFSWWAGLTIKDIKSGIASVTSKLHEETIDGKNYFMGKSVPSIDTKESVHLLPPFDEYIVSYKDRTAVLKTEHNNFVNSGGNGMFAPVIVINGKVVGSWKREMKKDAVHLMSHPFEKFTNDDKRIIAEAAERYGTFLGLPVKLAV